MPGDLAKPDGPAEVVTRRTDSPSRLGWEFWERPPPTPFPLEEQAPSLELLPPPNVDLIRRQHRSKTSTATVLCCLAVLMTVVGVVGEIGPLQAVGAGLWVLGFGLLMVEFLAVRWANRTYTLAVEAAEAEFRSATAQWDEQRARWYGDETRRVEALPTYYVLQQVDHRRRLDVFGGQPVGWACLLNTLARPLIDDGIGVAVLDFTESSIAVELCLYAAGAGSTVRYGLLPADLHRVDLLQGLGATEAAEVLIASSHAVRDRRGREDEEHQEVDRAVVAEVCRILGPDGLTMRRILAGLDIANQAAGSRARDEVTAEERIALEDNTYLTAVADRLRDRYPYLRPRLGALEEMATAGSGSVDVTALPWAGDVSVLAVEGSSRREMSLFANLAVQCVSQRLRQERARGDMPLLVVAGADLLTFETTMALSRRARQAGARTAFLFASLEEDARRVLGSEGSDTLFFQLQNHEQAEFAANFVGRRHRFVVGQVTKTAADSFGGSHGENRSWTTSQSLSESRGVTYAGLFKIIGDSTSKGSQVTQSYSEQTGTSWSATWGQTETYGETATRVYEYDTEPRTLQELDSTSFVFVSREAGRTKVTAADCNPGIEGIPAAVDYPRESCQLRATPPPPLTPPPATPEIEQAPTPEV